LRVFEQLSDARTATSEYKEALKNLDVALSFAKDNEVRSRLMRKKAHLHEIIGDLKGAIELYDKAWEILGEKQTVERAWILQSRGWLEGKLMADYEKGEELSEKSEDIAQKIGADSSGHIIAEAERNIGVFDIMRRRFKCALGHLNKMLSIYRAENNKRGMYRAIGNIGVVMRNMGEIEEALKYYEQSSNLA
jgi:tetratricopeptide (TPR) repeat protein